MDSFVVFDILLFSV